MIGQEIFERIARDEQTSVFPNIVREYSQHLFLNYLYRISGSEKLLFKGGTALRIVYNSPRFSEDLDFTLVDVLPSDTKKFVETLFVNVLAEMENTGIRVEIGSKSAPTSGGYFGIASFHATGYGPINIEINISSRTTRGELRGEVDSITSSFVPPYTLYHLPKREIVNEKVFGALLDRKKPRDFYDLYFMMRSGMLAMDQKKRLADVAVKIIDYAKGIDFQNELGVFLPASQQAIIRDFAKTLEREIRGQLALN